MRGYSAEKDYYAVLGVPHAATAAGIRTAFRKLAIQHHPDRNNGNAEAAQRFIHASEAYDVLRNPHSRSMYDRMCGRGFGSGASAGSPEAERVLSRHILQWSSTYARGVHALREACVAENNLQHPKYTSDGTVIYRPLTLRENLIGRLTEFHTLENPDGTPRSLEDRLALSSIWNDSCTGVLRKAQSTKFKIIPLFEPLITIDKECKEWYFPVSYDEFDVPELDSSKEMYNQSIPKNRILDNEAWRFAVEEDVATLSAYVAFVEAGMAIRSLPSRKAFMGFYVQKNTLRRDIGGALFVNDLGNNSNASGDSLLYSNGSFVRRSPVAKNFQRQIVG
ncbi:MAG: DnaJ domain-containing protein [Nanoarchaeota archaeon]